MSLLVRSIIIAIVHIAEALTVHIYDEYLFTSKKTGLKKLLAFAAGYTALFFILMIWDNYVLNTISCIAINAIIMYTIYSCGFITALFQATILAAFMALSETATNALLDIYVHDFTAYTYSAAALTALAVISKLMYVVLCFLAAKMFTPHKGGTAENRSMLKLCALPIASSLVSVAMMYLCFIIELSTSLQILVSSCLTILLFANIYTISIYSNMERINSDNLSMKLALLKDESDAEYYKMLQEQYDRQRILVHDVKNHMQIVEHLAAEGRNDEIQKYISEWGFDKGFQRQTRYCDNGILNIIVSKFAKDCEENGINFYCDIRDQSVSFIDDVDISALFGNLLSNAYEAAKESEEKVIELNIELKPTQKMTVIKVMNSCKEKPEKTGDGFLISRKKDKDKHGLGQKSIARIVEKYKGQADNYYDDENKQFDWVIVLSEQ